ncbi:MAG: ChaN family lipoprotein [Burkholderiaceae bacterium]|nr:ChaN family lipoprotein [Burkholderiaceae bacterium]
MNATSCDRPVPSMGVASKIGRRVAIGGERAAACLRLACALVLAGALAGCAATGASAPGLPPAPPASSHTPFVALPAAAADADFLLLGELHDNVAQHRLRLHWLEALAERHPFALALEQFDADRQDALDRARAEDTRESARPATAPDLAVRARRIAQAAGFDFHGWDWDLYRPAIELALRRGLPLVAANLSPADTTQVARGSVPPAPAPPGWGAEQTEAMRASIRQGHCGLLPERAVDAMGLAQRTRDDRIARALVDARERTGLPVVLLAGNGHLRRDIGVPLHLAALRPRARIVSIAMLERSGAGEGGSAAAPDQESFDLVVRTDAQPREDPCVALRERMQRRSPSTDSR